MAPRSQLSIPTIAALPHSHRLLSTSPEAFKTLSKLSRSSLISLALEWLEDSSRSHCAPSLSSDENSENEGDEAPYTLAQSIEELREIYQELEVRKGSKREVVDRILEGDWRRGVSLYQLATAETRYILDHPTAQRWTALRLRKADAEHDQEEGVSDDEQDIEHLPRFHAQTFLVNLQQEVAPVTKAHYYLTRANNMPITLLRVYIHDSPYNTQRSLQDHNGVPPRTGGGSKSVFLLFPDGTPFVYVSLASAAGQAAGSEGRSLSRVILDAVPKALSRAQARYVLQPTALTARSLQALLALRGPGRSSAAAGGWSIFAEDSFGHSALDYQNPRMRSQNSDASSEEKDFAASQRKQVRPSSIRGGGPDPSARKRLKLVAEGRFGRSAQEDDGEGIERLDVRIDDPFPTLSKPPIGASHTTEDAPIRRIEQQRKQSSRGRQSRPSLLDKTDSDDDLDALSHGWKPDVRLSFQGSHVFAGIRQLVESGIIDGERMPGWMTGEAAVSVGVVRHGKIAPRKGTEI